MIRKPEEVLKMFEGLFGMEPRTELNYKNDYELLVAVILSAQCTDKRVNIVTPRLFERFPTINALADADLAALTSLLSSVNFFNNKAKNIIGMARMVRDEFNGMIPSELEKLIKLPGVGRKTASVFVAEFHKIPAVAVDTHVGRVARHFGWTQSTNPEIIERDLKEIWDEKDWIRWHNYMVLYGRYYLRKRSPDLAS